MSVWRAILRARPTWEIAELRRAGLARREDRRWTRLAPALRGLALPRPRPAPEALPAETALTEA
jgi:hypothetical protein